MLPHAVKAPTLLAKTGPPTCPLVPSQCSEFADRYPSLHVLGFQKCGTSQLYSFLSNHKDVLPAESRKGQKEWCPKYIHGKDSTIRMNPSLYFSPLHSTSSHLTANGCLDDHLDESLCLHSCVAPHLAHPAKYFLVVRDPAGARWSWYNFFQNSMDGWDGVARNGADGRMADWAASGRDYRSPELFHELASAQGMVKNNPFQVQPTVSYWLDMIRRVQRHVGPQNLMVLHTAMLDDVNVHKRIAAFAGLSEGGFPNMSHVRLNSGSRDSSRGEANSQGSAALEGVYEVSGFRRMLDKTRELINERERKSCAILKAEFGVSCWHKGTRR